MIGLHTYKECIPSKQLMYICVFNNPKYVNLLELLLTSLAKTTLPPNTDFLVMTSSDLKPSIQTVAESLKLPVQFMLKDAVLTNHEAACMRLKIFDYPNINNYEKLLYLDTDIIIQHSLKPLLEQTIQDQLYALEEGTIDQGYHGSWYFDFKTIRPKTPAINSGVLLFPNTPLMKRMFQETDADIEGKRARKEHLPDAYDQPFINYHFIKAGKCNSALLKDYVQIFFQNPGSKPIVPICHFAGNMGDADDKLPRMKAHMERFIVPNISGKYLAYACVFYNKDYTELLRLLIASTKFYSSLQGITCLVFTNKEMEPLIQELVKSYQFPIVTKTFDYTTLFQAACARLSIFDYEDISSYEKILYLDTDILVKGDLKTLFELPLEDKLYGLESGFTDSVNFGAQFFNPPIKTSGINSGTLLFRNSSTIQSLFQRIRSHVDAYTKRGTTPPYALDQPFFNYHAIKDNLYDNQALKPYVALFEGEEGPENETTAIVCHFSYPIGNFGHKCNRMKTYLNKCLNHWVLKDPCSIQNHLVNKRFSWGLGFIEFQKPSNSTSTTGILNTKWGLGTYEFITENIICVGWHRYFHVIQIKDNTYFGLRTWPNDYIACAGQDITIPPIQNTIDFDETTPTPLCVIMGYYGSDKGSKDITKSWHNYTTLYYKLLKDKRESVKRVFELGIGTTDPTIPANMGSNGTPGASLRGWAEFFPNAQIFGADIDKRILFTENRIKTYYCDQLNPVVIKGMWLNKELVEGFDVILDDGLHRYDANICFLENSIHKLNPGGIYIIEDISNYNLGKFNEKIGEFKKLHPDLQYDIITLPNTINQFDNRVLVIRKETQIKILTVILSCLKHKHLWSSISERLNDNTIILCGGATETKLEGNILYLDCIDTYDGLSEKMMKAYEFILKSDLFTKFTHILKADDHDTYFELKQVKEIEIIHKAILNTQDYVGQKLNDRCTMVAAVHHFGKVPKTSPWYNIPILETFVPFLGGGEIYILSKKSLHAIVSDKMTYKKYCGCEDMMVGRILNDHNIHPYKLDLHIKTWIG